MKQFKSHIINVKKSKDNKVIVTFKKGCDLYKATKYNNTWSGCRLNKAGRSCGDIWNVKYEYNPDMSKKFDSLVDFINAVK